MCEYSPLCTKRDHELAGQLWQRSARMRARLLVVCPKKKCHLAAVYDLPNRGRVIFVPAHTFLAHTYYADMPESQEMSHRHASLRSMTEFGPEERDQGRCSCGTWSFAPARLEADSIEHEGRRLAYGSYVMMANTDTPSVEDT